MGDDLIWLHSVLYLDEVRHDALVSSLQIYNRTRSTKSNQLRPLKIIGVNETHPADSFNENSCDSSAVDGGQSSRDSSSETVD